MTAKQLKNSILQLAVQGKLSEQRPNEVVDIDAPEVADEDKPFEIPANWKWVRLGDVVKKITDGTHHTPKYTMSGVPFLSVKDISSGKIDFSNTKFVSAETHAELIKRCHPEQGDLLLTKVGTTGIPVIIDTDKEFSLFVSVALIKFSNDIFVDSFLVNLINSPSVQMQCGKNTRGVGNKNWVIRDIKATLIPLPPLAEQQRIVAKIEELLPLIEQYGEGEVKLNEINAKFPIALKKSLLQEAVQGKLVPQCAEDEPASALLGQIAKEKAELIKQGKIKKQKQLAPVSDEEKPFDVPESWEWVRLGDLAFYKKGPFGSSITKSMFVPDSENAVKVYEQKNAIQKDATLGDYYITQEKYEELSTCEVFADDIIVSCAGTIGETYVMPKNIRKGIINQALMRVKLYSNEIIDFYLIYFDFMLKTMAQEGSKGSAIKNIPPLDELKNYLIPLPPFDEQKRIVAKLEELFAVVEGLG